MFEIFPGNYAWSQAALRAMFTGVSPGDALAAAERLGGATAGDPDAWHAAWAAVGKVAAGRATAQRSAGHPLSARASFLTAAMCVQWAVAFLPPSDPRRPAGHRHSVELFGAFAELADPPIVYRDIPCPGGSYPAWLVRPAAAGPAPCAIYLPGWDSTKEQGIGLAMALAERGIASLLCDGPGTGEAIVFRGLVNRHDAEVPGSAAFDALLGEPGINPARIGVVGSSLGGYRAARFAAFEPRLAAAVIWGASWDFGRTWRKQMANPGSALPTSIEHALHVMGASSAEEVTTMLDRWTLDGVAGRIACPLLILHGAEDSQIPTTDAERLYAAATSTDKTLRIFTTEEGGSAHCQNDNRVRAHDEIGDWLADRLRSL